MPSEPGTTMTPHTLAITGGTGILVLLATLLLSPELRALVIETVPEKYRAAVLAALAFAGFAIQRYLSITNPDGSPVELPYDRKAAGPDGPAQ